MYIYKVMIAEQDNKMRFGVEWDCHIAQLNIE